jgi:hypothetical protein
VEKTAAERGGIDPCQSPDDGFGIYERWRAGTGAGKLLVPDQLLPRPDRSDEASQYLQHGAAQLTAPPEDLQ